MPRPPHPPALPARPVSAAGPVRTLALLPMALLPVALALVLALFVGDPAQAVSRAPAAPAPPAVPARAAPAPAAATGTPLGSGPGLYPRAVRLTASGSANGRIIASVVSFEGGDGVGLVHESTDNGASFHPIGRIADPESAGGQGLCCSTLFELPRQIGALPPGTLLWASSAGQSEPNRRMALRIWRSADTGRSWSYLSSCAVAGGTGGLWEPEFSVAADGALVCHYADETDPAHSQKLAAARSYDGVTWRDHRSTVASARFEDRPGMPVVRRLPDGSFLMSYEICNPGGQYQCAVHLRSSADGWNWGDPRALGTRPETVDGRYLRAAPTLAWAPSPDGAPHGRLLLVAQRLLNRDGSPAADSGRTVLANTENGTGPWYEIEAPARVEAPEINHCQNYSSPLVPSADGSRFLEIATDWSGPDCRPYFATGSALGTGDATGVADGAAYRLLNANSGHCLDVAGDGREAGADVQQWTCNGLGPQAWTLRARGGGHYTLTGRNSGHCLDLENGSTAPGADVRQWFCNAQTAQDWRLVNAGRGAYRLVSRASGQCLDVSAGSRLPGGDVRQWTCNGLQPQLWILQRL
ncbi:RICIN domain-containing protein [Streptomyces zaomyceticus]|uniref:RICIN domain-containing protein n=1 Tax=Streptomyces zaomyceticus TaxID=68286 RepID=UPI003667A225